MHHQTFLNDLVNINQMETISFSPTDEKPDAVKPASIKVSPAIVAQAERECSSESADSSDSSDEDTPSDERSRPVVRTTTHRRSASPMRRIQIGRSGSRRSNAITIKSLNYFQSRAISNRDADARENEAEELEHVPKKPENNVGRMSVQDAISLFESKQKVQNSDVQKGKTSEVSVSANKAVLRRWSSGMGDSFIDSTQEKDHVKLDPETEEKKENERKDDLSNQEIVPIGMSEEIARTEPLEGIALSETVVSTEGWEGKDQSSTADLNQQKEAELNEMLMKMMRSDSPTTCSGVKVVNDLLKDTSIDLRGGIYGQYNKKRNQKLRAENARNNATNKEQFKLTNETLEKSKAAKPTGSAAKRDSTNLSQKPGRTSSPPVLSKKEILKPTNTKKASSKSSSSPQIPRALSSGSLKNALDKLPPKSSPVVSISSTPGLQKSRPSSSPAQRSPRTKKPIQHMKGNSSATSVVADIKPTLFDQEHKIVKAAKNNRINVKPKSPLSKPSVQSKYTRKSNVVPLESKPFLRKGSRIISVNGPSVSKAKDTRISKSLDSLKSTENFALPEEQESNPSTNKVIGDDLARSSNVVDETLAAPLDNDNIETTEIVNVSLTRIDSDIRNPVEPIIAEIHQDEDLGISSAAWVEAENQEYSPLSNTRKHIVVVSPMIIPTASSSPRVNHSLSHMLQVDNNEQEIIEWGNAENPPSLVYQKDVPKGLKRLLKFARKNKGEGNLNPSVFSDGEEEHEESKAAIKRNSDAQLRKASLQAKGYGQPKSLVSESLDLGNSIKWAMEHSVHDDLSGSNRLRNGHFSTGVTAPKATRSFFSLSTFRSGKSNETKPQ